MDPKSTPETIPNLDDDLLTWRQRTLGILLWVIVAARGAQVCLYLKEMIRVSGTLTLSHLMTVSPFLALLALALLRRLPHGLRGWSVLLLGYINVVLVFAITSRLEGPTPLTLVSLPIFALILLGQTSAWTAATVSAALFGTFATLLHFGMMPPAQLTLGSQEPLQTWGLWLVIFVPVFTLQDRFIALFQRQLGRERETRKCLQKEMAERTFLECALLETSERERQIVGHELHDGVCQQITGAMLHCKALEKAVIDGTVPPALSIQAIATMLDNALSQVHDLARGMSPGTLSAEMLVPSLRDLARRTKETSEVDCEVEAGNHLQGLSPMAATHLYHIAQEAMVNAVKHGHPSRIAVRLITEANSLLLEVRNDGQTTGSSTREDVGLRIMRHRSDLLGATFSILTTDRDSCLRCRVPLPVPKDGIPSSLRSPRLPFYSRVASGQCPDTTASSPVTP